MDSHSTPRISNPAFHGSIKIFDVCFNVSVMYMPQNGRIKGGQLPGNNWVREKLKLCLSPAFLKKQ